jgi:hypothetical protein
MRLVLGLSMMFFTSLALAAGSAEKGKAAFVKHGCWQCHGFVGQGSIAGAKLAPNPLPFETLSAFVRNTNGRIRRRSSPTRTSQTSTPICSPCRRRPTRRASRSSIPRPPHLIAAANSL